MTEDSVDEIAKSVEIVVVTEVPPPGDQGNLATALSAMHFRECRDGESYDAILPPIDQKTGLGLALACREQVFQLGEILFLDPNGREVLGAQRKPDKWDVTVTPVSDLKRAIALALRVEALAREVEDEARQKN